MLKKQTIKQLIRILCSASILLFLFYHIDWSKLVSSFASVRPQMPVVVLALLVPALLVRSFRWLILFNDHAFSVTMSDSMRLLMAGMGLNLFLPASLGDVAKSYFGYRWSGVKERMLSVSLLDKVIALSSVCLLGIPFAVYMRQYKLGLLALLVIVPALLFLAMPFLLRHGELFQRIVHFCTRCLKSRIDMYRVIEETRTTNTKLLAAIVLSVMGWMLTYLQLYLIFRGLGVEVSVFYVFAAAPFLTLVRLFPFALQGLGTDELAICFVFKQAGVGYEESMTAALIYRLFLIILPGVAGLVVLMRHRKMENAVGA